MTLKIELGHRSSIPHARWCQPIGWTPANNFAEWEFVEGAWWSEAGEELAGLVAFVEGDEGDRIEVELDDLRVARCGDCRVIGEVELGSQA